jgi:hypothetical protein
VHLIDPNHIYRYVPEEPKIEIPPITDDLDDESRKYTQWSLYPPSFGSLFASTQTSRVYVCQVSHPAAQRISLYVSDAIPDVGLTLLAPDSTV